MSKEHLLEGYSLEDDSLPAYKLKERGNRQTTFLTLCLVLACLAVSNIFLYLQNQSLQNLQYASPSKFSGLTYDTPMTYHNYTDYMHSNNSISDKLWDDLDISPLVVALSDDWAEEHGLPVSVFRFPWDEKSKGLYYLKAFHGLHCLKSMRKAFVDYERGLPPQIHSWHVHHCLDTLRQDLMCTADDTPMPGVAKPHEVGNGQVRMCRNFDKLVEWTHAPEREACYRRLTDYGGVINAIERYAYCPEDSQYHPIMEAYFEKWGHKDPFGESGHSASS